MDNFIFNGFKEGGSTDIVPECRFIQVCNYLFNLTIEAKDKHNETVPIWGTCLGFEQLAVYATGDYKILDSFSAENISYPLKFTNELKDSRLFSQASSEVIYNLQNYKVTINQHSYGISSSESNKHESFQKYKEFFRIISTNVDKKGKPFISTVEAYNYPIYSSQWHPERAVYEWNSGIVINREKSIVVSNYVGRFFISEARKNSHSFSSPTEEYNLLFYNFKDIYDESLKPWYETVYFW
ncbi:protease family c26 gamma-glutamyl hydrolase [Anaeramoeba flamelloides]|uniref:folate gamma-glutamyl hydrolase n=1 Tax=Anaeramoeba flamelloides TaxID=1746091 RepID=A0ABQ8Y9D1_9EUKA|nr:protease family c26 gamma-glutamyl hydrolase [Anaeramoeba flamelloides]